MNINSMVRQYTKFMTADLYIAWDFGLILYIVLHSVSICRSYI